MEIETKRDALLHCFDLWLWLAVTGAAHKMEWPGWKFNGGYLGNCENNCPCCGYASCSQCPIDIWANGYCESEDSPFTNWFKSQTKTERSKWALEIAILALDAL